MNYNNLTEHEKHIIIEKGTERPFTGAYHDHKQTGTYLCKQCSSPLYRSTNKFDSGCGRPSFDDALPNAIKRTTDADGMRTEITCTTCGGHLGHVFIGERMTDKNTRHCVNSASLQFTTEIIKEGGYDVATFGTGCFWCSQAAYDGLPGIIQTTVGYSGGKRPFPTYEQICTGVSGHQEVTQIIYDANLITYEKLLEIFFKIHDPTSFDKQGADTGSKYRSIIFTHNQKQETQAHTYITNIQDSYGKPIVTEIKPLEKLRIAEGYHQKYFENNPEKPYCQIVVQPKVDTVKEILAK